MGAALSLIACVAVPLGSGMAVGVLTKDEITGWYSGLKKPSWNPPNWVFGPAWAVFYTSMGIASWVTVRKGVDRKGPLFLYALQLALNLGWTPIMFKAHKIDVALVDATAMLGVAVAATVSMTKSTKAPAAVLPLMVPYLAWVTFATALTGELLRLNPTETLDYSALRAQAHEGKEKAKAAAKDAGAKAAAKAKEAATVVGEASSKVADKAAAKASEVADLAAAKAAEVAKKASEDMAELKTMVKEAVASSSVDEASKPLLS